MSRQAPKPLKGVYYLANDSQLIYIGSTRNLTRRLYRHKYDGTPYTQVFFNEMPHACERDLRDAENDAILELRPKLNEAMVSIGNGPEDSR